MPRRTRYLVQAFKRRQGMLSAGEAYPCADEDAVYRRGRVMQDRVDGLAFFKIETSADGDIWTDVTLLSTVGDVPDLDAA